MRGLVALLIKDLWRTLGFGLAVAVLAASATLLRGALAQLLGEPTIFEGMVGVIRLGTPLVAWMIADRMVTADAESERHMLPALPISPWWSWGMRQALGLVGSCTIGVTQLLVAAIYASVFEVVPSAWVARIAVGVIAWAAMSWSSVAAIADLPRWRGWVTLLCLAFWIFAVRADTPLFYTATWVARGPVTDTVDTLPIAPHLAALAWWGLWVGASAAIARWRMGRPSDPPSTPTIGIVALPALLLLFMNTPRPPETTRWPDAEAGVVSTSAALEPLAAAVRDARGRAVVPVDLPTIVLVDARLHLDGEVDVVDVTPDNIVVSAPLTGDALAARVVAAALVAHEPLIPVHPQGWARLGLAVPLSLAPGFARCAAAIPATAVTDWPTIWREHGPDVGLAVAMLRAQASPDTPRPAALEDGLVRRLLLPAPTPEAWAPWRPTDLPPQATATAEALTWTRSAGTLHLRSDQPLTDTEIAWVEADARLGVPKPEARRARVRGAEREVSVPLPIAATARVWARLIRTTAGCRLPSGWVEVAP